MKDDPHLSQTIDWALQDGLKKFETNLREHEPPLMPEDYAIIALQLQACHRITPMIQGSLTARLAANLECAQADWKLIKAVTQLPNHAMFRQLNEAFASDSTAAHTHFDLTLYAEEIERNSEKIDALLQSLAQKTEDYRGAFLEAREELLKDSSANVEKIRDRHKIDDFHISITQGDMKKMAEAVATFSRVYHENSPEQWDSPLRTQCHRLCTNALIPHFESVLQSIGQNL